MPKSLVQFVSVFCLAATLVVGQPVSAQAPDATEKAELTGTRKQLATIIFSGLAGAILGLSTLSFYGRPQEHLSNIAVGFAIGVIGGTIYTTYKAATKPYDVYDLSLSSDVWMPREAFETMKAGGYSDGLPMSLSYSWNF